MSEGLQCVGPSSIHPNGNQYRWRSAWGARLVFGASRLDQMLPQAPEQLVALFSKDRPSEGAAPKSSDEEIPEGKRDDTLTSIAGGLRRLGLDEAAIYKRLAAVNAERCHPPLPDADVMRIAKSATRWAAEGDVDTDLANALRFVQMHGDRLRHCEALGDAVWFQWTGKLWSKGLRSIAIAAARETVEEMSIEAACAPDANMKKKLAAWAKKSKSKEKLHAMAALAGLDLEIDPDAFDADWTLLNVQNGTLVLNSDGSVVLREHRREDFISKIAAAPYDPTARCEHWDNTLNRVLPDTELRDYVQRCFGYTLLGGQGEKAIFIAWGPGNGGKSTVVKALLRALGDYGTVTRLATFGAGADGSGNTPSLAMLHGPRLIVINEVPPMAKLSTGLVKSWSGGDLIEACQKMERPFTYEPAGKLWFLGNDRPEIPYEDDAAWARTHVLPFDHPIPKEQQIDDFVDRVNLAAVLAWAIEGYRMWAAGGLQPPARAREAVEEYREAQDPLADFIEQRLDITPEGWEATADLHAEYTLWSKGRGNFRPMAKPAFSTALVTGRPALSLDRRGKARVKGISGVKIRRAPAGAAAPSAEAGDEIFG